MYCCCTFLRFAGYSQKKCIFFFTFTRLQTPTIYTSDNILIVLMFVRLQLLPRLIAEVCSNECGKNQSLVNYLALVDYELQCSSCFQLSAAPHGRINSEQSKSCGFSVLKQRDKGTFEFVCPTVAWGQGGDAYTPTHPHTHTHTHTHTHRFG
jgi:hypothetical protein